MPNGLLRLSTSLQPRAGVGTTVTPKDQSARLGKKKCWKILGAGSCASELGLKVFCRLKVNWKDFLQKIFAIHFTCIVVVNH